MREYTESTYQPLPKQNAHRKKNLKWSKATTDAPSKPRWPKTIKKEEQRKKKREERGRERDNNLSGWKHEGELPDPAWLLVLEDTVYQNCKEVRTYTYIKIKLNRLKNGLV